MTQAPPTLALTAADGPPVEVLNPHGAAELVLVCEHASPMIPAALGDLGLHPAHRLSHAVWDPGAFDLALALSERLDAPLVAGRFSRLVFDCNRPPNAESAIPAQSERIAVPGNLNLAPAEKTARADAIYRPFHDALTRQIAAMTRPAIVTIHSFTPIFNGKERAVELGILFDPRDDRLGRALLHGGVSSLNTQPNAPYGAGDGVFHTLERHALPANLLNAMIELRNDLLTTPEARADLADMLPRMIQGALAQFAQLRAAP